MSKSFPKKILK